MERLFIDRSNAAIERTDLCLVRLTLSDGQVFEELEPRRLFPFTAPDTYVTLLNDQGHEVAVIRSLSDLDETSETAIRESLEEFYMIPHIIKMLDTEDVNGAIKWHVMTDRGEIEFRIHNRNSDIKCLRGTRHVMVRDADDNRYHIPDYTALDRHSKHLLYPFL